MIALLRGRVAGVQEDAVVLDVGGVGYLVHAAPRVLAQLQTTRDAIELHIDTQVREDSITLFGFLDPAERVWFRMLQAIQGVGARTALAVLGTLTPEQLVTAVAAQDRAALTRAAGVGPKLASRILAELKDRVGMIVTRPSTAAHGPTGSPPGGVAGDAVSALVNLGYGRIESFGAVARAQSRLGEAAA